MRNKDLCVFAAEEDCPKEKIGLTCEECVKLSCYKIIENATEDFVSLGDSFTDLFNMCNNLIKNNSKTVKVKIPVDSIHVINRVMNAFLKTDEEAEKDTIEDKFYQRLIYYFFNIVIDDFIEKEYAEKELLH